MDVDRIRFSMAKPYWNELAAHLDIPSYTTNNNWEGLAEQLEFKLRDIEHMKVLRHDSGSNTIIMFEQYVRKTEGGDLHQVLDALEKLKRPDAHQVLSKNYEDIKARNMREYGPEPMASPEPMVITPPQSQAQQDIILQQQREIQELKQQQQHQHQQQHQQQQQQQQQRQDQQLYLQQQRSLMQVGQPSNLRPPAPHPQVNQAMYIPKPEQIPPHLWPFWLQIQADQRMQAQQHPHHVQEAPINLKKPPTGPINLYQNFNRRTDKDFPIGFADQYRLHSPDSNPSLEPQMDSLRNINQSLGVPSMHFSGPKEYPADFPEVLGRGENGLASLTQEPMVIAPIPDRPVKPTLHGNHKSNLMEFSDSDKNRLAQSDLHFAVTNTMLPHQQPSLQHFSNESFLSRSQVPYTRLPSGGLVREPYQLVPQAHPALTSHGAFPVGHIKIKEEKTEDTKPMEVTDTFPAHRPGVTPQPQHQQRQSVIQAGPQCNSWPSASPGDISQMSSPGTVKDEEDTNQRVHSLEERPTQKLIGKGLRPKRFTWPLTSKVLKDRHESHKPEPPQQPPALGAQAQSASVDRNYKQPPFKKKPVKVLLTYTMGTKDMKTHKKELTVLYNCLLKNAFLPSLDFKEEHEFNRDMQRWLDTRYREANFVIVCISPQYKKDVAHHEDLSHISQSRSARCCRYIHNLMQTEFVHQGSHNKRFLPVLFPGSTTDDIPMWMRSIVAFRWREHWRDIMYMMLEPKDIIDKIKGNKERFAEQQEGPIIRMTQSCS